MAIFSDRRRRPRALALILLAGLVASTVSPAGAQVRLTQEEALRLAFPEPAVIERRTAYLDEGELARASDLAGSEVKGGVVTYYVALSGDAPLGVAWFDVHRVRTLPEVLMIVVSPAGAVDRIELLRFAEPPKYAAPEGWLDRFTGRRLPGDLDGKHAVAGMTGATLTSRAVTGAVRRALALQQIIRPLEKTAEHAELPGG